MSTSATNNGRLHTDEKCKQRKYQSFLFYQAVRDLKPVWMLEDMRTMETFYWEEDASQRSYTPSEALLYAIVHDHQAYAQYLLSHYTDEALAMPGERFCCCPSSAPHLAMAVRYDRRDILGLILQEAHRLPSLRSYMNRGGCFHMEDGKTPLHLACELLRSESVILLLGNGASPQAEDQNGMTPLDVILEQLWDSKVNIGPKKLCLDNLLMFMPEIRFKMKSALEGDPVCWSKVLGEDKFKYLVGQKPAPLFLMAMQTILRQLPPEQFPDSLDELPIPSSLKPLPCKQLGQLKVF
ncbi:ankyrin repeat domain-containing protein 9 [Oncorhynchus tshawytscha]|uniref:Ankyrin repeat domain-containing protein 9 n=3 Tax=Salmoninae TaxID=504568 RepID=A0AAZ3S508_ONCTS|nr:ankyrin repeat domain-containing protein 9 [Salmo salar]XP_021456649.1 ankyrin repeat domain-containing protein 9 [Oncorhynchus mykiss]XP_024234483.1 ankyrin repeat domain-containing protein 9 [Oncorhynchus tshawytscha]|eukprot:XP_014061442.1 PREDICTED: ankyrin repeat domain-containing protein 9-like [Salmo salar]